MTYIPEILTGRIVDGTILDDDVNSLHIDGLAATPSMRTLGTGAQQALAGNTTLNAISAPTGTVDMNSQQFSNLATANAAGQAVEYSQFVSALDGLYYKDPVDLATTGNISLTGEQTIDGTLTSGSRVLVKDQTTASENGIYITAAGAWTRASDADSGTELDDGATVWVKSGTVNGDTRQTQTLTVTTIGTDNQNWAQTGSATTVTSFSDLSDGNLTSPADGQLLRYEASVGELQNTANAVLSDAGQLQLPTTGASAGILIGGDGQIYRSAADELTTPDALIVSGTLTSNGNFDHEGMIGVVKSVATNTNAVVADDYYIEVDSAGGSRTVTLPTTPSTGTTFEIKRVGANDVVISGAQNIDGAASFTLDVNYMAAKLVYNGTQWLVY